MNLKCVTTPVAWFGMPINSFFAQIHKFDHLVNNMVHFLTVLNCSFNFKRIFNNLQPSLNEYLTLVTTYIYKACLQIESNFGSNHHLDKNRCQYIFTILNHFKN